VRPTLSTACVPLPRAGIGYRLTNTIVRLYDAAHESIFAKQITGTPDAFDTDLNGPIFGPLRAGGLEDKQRTDPAAGSSSISVPRVRFSGVPRINRHYFVHRLHQPAHGGPRVQRFPGRSRMCGGVGDFRRR